MDPTIIVAILALGGTILTVGGSIAVAVYTTRKSSTTAAESSLEKTLRERILLRNEQIEELKEDKRELLAENSSLQKDKIRLQSQLRSKEEENRVLKRTLVKKEGKE